MEILVKAITRPFCVESLDGAVLVQNNFSELSGIPEGQEVRIFLPKIQVQTQAVQDTRRRMTGAELRLNGSYAIKVRQYMTKPATPDFDFMQKWNNNIPMPFRTMVGTVVKETRGMVMMDLHCRPFKTDTCMRCGRQLTHPVSRLYGIGPECGGHAHINPFETEEQLQEALEDVRSKLKNIRWRGWIIKTAIEDAMEVGK